MKHTAAQHNYESKGSITRPKRPLSAFNLFCRFKRQQVADAITRSTAGRAAIIALIEVAPGLERYPELQDASPEVTESVRKHCIRKEMVGNLLPRENRSHRKDDAMNGAMGFMELVGFIRGSWKSCDEFGKDVFRELADEGRVLYRRRMQDWKDTTRRELAIGELAAKKAAKRLPLKQATDPRNASMDSGPSIATKPSTGCQAEDGCGPFFQEGEPSRFSTLLGHDASSKSNRGSPNSRSDASIDRGPFQASEPSGGRKSGGDERLQVRVKELEAQLATERLLGRVRELEGQLARQKTNEDRLTRQVQALSRGHDAAAGVGIPLTLQGGRWPLLSTLSRAGESRNIPPAVQCATHFAGDGVDSAATMGNPLSVQTSRWPLLSALSMMGGSANILPVMQPGTMLSPSCGPIKKRRIG